MTTRRAASGGPTRIGVAASSRDFGTSSAAGAASNNRHTVTEAERDNKQRAWGDAYSERDDSIRNDYAGHYVQTGVRPQNFIFNTRLETRFDEYPKLKALLKAKHALLDSEAHSIPPVVWNKDPVDAVAQLAASKALFDVILLSPPPDTTYEQLASLNIPKIASSPGFVWIWVGSGQPGQSGGIGLERGRDLLASWGYRRCEDIVWLKTNRDSPEHDLVEPCESLLRPTIEHCLMGIRGTVRRSNDGWFAHCNVDTDVIVDEQDPLDKDMKPQEIQSLIENFCLGSRRLHLYAPETSARRGWLSVGDKLPSATDENLVVRKIELESTKWRPVQYSADRWSRFFLPLPPAFVDPPGEAPPMDPLVPLTPEVDNLRPKSPPGRPGVPSSGGLGRGRGAGLGVTRSELANRVGLAGPAAGRGRGRGIAARPSPIPAPTAAQQAGISQPRAHSEPPLYQHRQQQQAGPYQFQPGPPMQVPSPVFPWSQPWPPNADYVPSFGSAATSTPPVLQHQQSRGPQRHLAYDSGRMNQPTPVFPAGRGQPTQYAFLDSSANHQYQQPQLAQHHHQHHYHEQAAPAFQNRGGQPYSPHWIQAHGRHHPSSPHRQDHEQFADPAPYQHQMYGPQHHQHHSQQQQQFHLPLGQRHDQHAPQQHQQQQIPDQYSRRSAHLPPRMQNRPPSSPLNQSVQSEKE